ncbi:MAG: helix-turn-helix domain-containing protein [Bacteroidota bacterium]
MNKTNLTTSEIRLILATSEEMKAIVYECLNEFTKPIAETPLIESPKYLHSLRDLASFLGCSVGTAQKLKNSGRIRYKQFGRKCVFNTSEILEDINKSKRR